jgi:hypothetical protein
MPSRDIVYAIIMTEVLNLYFMHSDISISRFPLYRQMVVARLNMQDHFPVASVKDNTSHYDVISCRPKLQDPFASARKLFSLLHFVSRNDLCCEKLRGFNPEP